MNIPEASFPESAFENDIPDLGIRRINGDICLLVEPIVEGEMLMIEKSSDGEIWSPWYAFYNVPEISEIFIPEEVLTDPNALIRARVSPDDRVPEVSAER